MNLFIVLRVLIALKRAVGPGENVMGAFATAWLQLQVWNAETLGYSVTGCKKTPLFCMSKTPFCFVFRKSVWSFSTNGQVLVRRKSFFSRAWVFREDAARSLPCEISISIFLGPKKHFLKGQLELHILSRA